MKVHHALEDVLKGRGDFRAPDEAQVAEIVHEFRCDMANLARDLDPSFGPLRLPKQRLSRVLTCERSVLASLDQSYSPNLATVLGQMVDRAVHHHVLCGPLDPATAYDVAVDALAAEGNGETLEFIGEAEAWLRTNVEQHAVCVVDSLGLVDPQWWPRCERRVRVDIADGAVVATARFDVQFGGVRCGRPTVITEIKSGGARRSDHDEPRWYALLETLQSGRAPVATIVLWTSDGKTLVEPVRLDTLASAARRTVEATRRLVDLAAGKPPQTNANPRCPFCPARPQCAAGLGWILPSPENSEFGQEDDPGAW